MMAEGVKLVRGTLKSKAATGLNADFGIRTTTVYALAKLRTGHRSYA